MAHPAQREFIESCLSRFAGDVTTSSNILEVGSQDINGSIRDYFPSSASRCWVGLDVGKGKGVDFVIPGELVQLPDGWADISFSTECFEHAKCWREILLNMIRATREGGLIVLTFAGTGRAAHGTIDTEPDSSPYTNDYYKNISVPEMASSLPLDKYFSRYSLESNSDDGDTYFWGLRTHCVDGVEWMSPEESLARARGQLGMIITTNRDLQRRNRELEERIREFEQNNGNLEQSDWNLRQRSIVLEKRLQAVSRRLLFLPDCVARISGTLGRRLRRSWGALG